MENRNAPCSELGCANPVSDISIELSLRQIPIVWIVPASALTQMSEAILSLFSRPDLRKQMGKNGRMLVQEKFRWDDVLARDLYAYKRVCGLVA